MILDDKVAIVTGGGRNMGKGIAKRLGGEGAHVVVVDIDGPSAEKTFEEIKGAHKDNKGFGMKVDVRVNGDVEAMVEKVMGDLGKIDILVNNAGVLTANRITDLTEEEWNHIMDVNAKGVFLCSRAVVREMIKRKSGKIINISSNAGKTGMAFLTHYCASKFAVIGFTQALAKELIPYGINVNAICPGNMNLPQHFGATEKIARILGLDKSLEELLAEQRSQRIHRRLGEPEDIASLVVYLSSDECQIMTGQAINVSGGTELH